jgi:AraC family transcriptional activator of pyochelin receptor
MAIKEIFEHNIPELAQGNEKLRNEQNDGYLKPVMHTRHPDFGTFQVSSMTFQDLNVSDMRWGIPSELRIHETTPSEVVDVNFVLEGNVHGSFRGLGADFEMRSGTTNLKYTPDERSVHQAKRQDARMFVVSIDKNYFANLLGTNSRWTENIYRKLMNRDNFIASSDFVPFTPHMHAMIHAICATPEGPMSRLFVQSAVFELLAHHLDLLCMKSTNIKPLLDVTLEDQEKLHVARSYIENHFLEELNLTLVCRHALLNEFKLKKGFRALFGVSVIKYARQLRMEYARSLLRDHRLTVAEVSVRLGYHYPNHFAVAYKKYFGVTPSR